MCIGVPMQVVEAGFGQALCAGYGAAAGQRRVIDTLLVGDQPAGTWLLVFLGGAREVIDATLAGQLADALQAVEMAMAGATDVSHLFADLIERGPQLPAHLRTSHPGGAVADGPGPALPDAGGD